MKRTKSMKNKWYVENLKINKINKQIIHAEWKPIGWKQEKYTKNILYTKRKTILKRSQCKGTIAQVLTRFLVWFIIDSLSKLLADKMNDNTYKNRQNIEHKMLFNIIRSVVFNDVTSSFKSRFGKCLEIFGDNHTRWYRIFSTSW